MKSDQDNLNVLRAIHKKPKSSQREMAKYLGFSLGKLNYCLKALKNKGLIKMQNFKKQPDGLNIFNMFLLQRVYRKEQI